ncbi:hypothetical protein CONLIGDRAFT_26712 [Coniochaeta ligniaria NRRL 30616]|uniref:Uncharacterized protein n=1 Tax=Coniochaeta ligniaria NRRL 30616 TaxID=1408157 RepID=A0A1J7K3R8_9PEZI|nr:hypothetical protein CONLIGDRAFT_26712 [Coniochaeta ligniaria NRRL 30616]
MNFQYDDQECVMVDNFSATRPPQHKKANVSSQQVAGTTAALLVDALATAIQTTLHMGEAYEPDYTIDHKPPSNMSNDTTSTDATAVANVAASDMAFTTPTYVFTGKGLTESVLANHQYELQLLNPGDMGAWLEGAGARCTHLAVAGHQKKGCGRCHAPRSKPSQASDASYDFVSSPATEAGRGLDIMAAGALFNEQTFNPSIYNSHLDV